MVPCEIGSDSRNTRIERSRQRAPGVRSSRVVSRRRPRSSGAAIQVGLKDHAGHSRASLPQTARSAYAGPPNRSFHASAWTRPRQDATFVRRILDDWQWLTSSCLRSRSLSRQPSGASRELGPRDRRSVMHPVGEGGRRRAAPFPRRDRHPARPVGGTTAGRCA